MSSASMIRIHTVHLLHRLVGLVVKVSASRERPGFDSCFRQGFFFSGRVVPVTYMSAVQRLPLLVSWCNRVSTGDRIVGLVVKASTSGAEDPGFESRLRDGIFPGRVMPVI